MIIDFTYKEENFVHLLGLHKLEDIQLIQLFNDKNNKKVQTKYIISRIKKEEFTDAMVKASVFYQDIASRYESFSYESLITLTYTDTFCTRFCENETNIKVIQEIMGHSDISTTMDVYAEATKEKKKEAFDNLEGKIKIC